ncbi:hypothetical protein RZS08_57160, partial [Arthrospira platensis SPKY1]|nr:hypothetical protein [Arthrospira platensis SPKY1]
MRISSFSTSEITWSPVSNLFVDEDATIAYTEGDNVSTVYFKSLSSGEFNVTATATNIFDCSISDDVTIDVNEAPAAPIAEAQEFCDGATVADLTATIP